MKIKQFRMHIGHYNQFRPYLNDKAKENMPTWYSGWFSLDELRRMNVSFECMPDSWEPVIARTYQDHIKITWPSNPIYFVWCSEIREIEVNENATAQ